MTSFKYPLFYKALFSCLFIIGLGILVIIRSEKSKGEFFKITGTISLLTSDFEGQGLRSPGALRYLQLSNSNRVFELFIGKEKGDFKPDYEIIDSLKIGDIIDLYYDDNFKTESDQINSLTYFIYKNKTPIFIKGGSEKMLGLILVTMSLLIIVITSYLKLMGKIV